MKIGFPVIVPNTEKAYPVWITTDQPPRGGETSVVWKTPHTTLNRRTPFKASDLNMAVQHILKNRTMVFDFEPCAKCKDNKRKDNKCEDCPMVRPESGGKDQSEVKIGDSSWGLALALAEISGVPDLIGSSTKDQKDIDFDVLLTGQVSHDFSKTIPLGSDSHDLDLKAKCAIDGGHILIVLEQDYKRISKDLTKAGDSVTWLPDSRERLEEFLTDPTKNSHIYALPVTEEGWWKQDLPSKKKWNHGLAELLGLKVLNFKDSTEESDSKNFSITAPIKKKNIGELFRAALPSSASEEYLKGFLKHNEKECLEDVFQNGIVDRLLKDSEKLKLLFYNDEDGDTFQYRHILIGGPTGCGKTFLTQAIMLNTVLEVGLPVLYIAPTRALVYEFHKKVLGKFYWKDNSRFLENDIIVSSGEFNKEDWRLTLGEFRIAMVVNEKANLFLRPEVGLLDRIGLVILDELHMLAHSSRGGVLDLLTAKLMQAREERAINNTGLPPVRIAAITTEHMAQEENILKYFSFQRWDGSRLEPISILTSIRPIPVRHSVYVYSRNKIERKVDLVEFKDQSDRFLPPAKISSLKTDLRTKILNVRREHQRGGRQDYAPTQKDIILMHAVSYKRIIAFLGSNYILKWLTDLIGEDDRWKNGHVNYDPNSNCDPETNTLEVLKRFISRGIICQTEGNRMIKLAEKGIYIHNAELPYQIRDWVESRFSRAPTDRDHCEILLSTETLAYGVNLSADCVVLANTNWTRQNLSENEPEERPLSSTEYHNILGRAGRPGFGPKTAAAVVLLNAIGSDQNLGTILSYYSKLKRNPDARDTMSSLLIQDDLFKRKTIASTYLHKSAKQCTLS